MKKIDEIKSLAPFKELLPAEMMTDIPVVEGHELTPVQWLAFQFFIKSTTMEECARELRAIGIEISARKLSKWKRTDWWTTLTEASAEWLQENFYLKVWKDSHICQEALTKIWKGEWANQLTANAVVASFRELNRMGKGRVDPISQNRRDFNIKITKEETISIEHIQRNLGEMTPEEHLEFGRTGNLPERLQNIVEIEHHPIEEEQDDENTEG